MPLKDDIDRRGADLAAQRVLIKSPTPEPDVAAIGEAVIAVRNDTPVLLRDVATVEQAPALRFGARPSVRFW